MDITRRQYNVIHPHCGPWNQVNDSEPEDPVDAICYRHDVSYGEIPNAFWQFNEADEDFIREMDLQGGLFPTFYSSVFKLKHVIHNWFARDPNNLEHSVKYTTVEGKPQIINMPYKRKRSNSYGKGVAKRRRRTGNVLAQNFVDGPWTVLGAEKRTAQDMAVAGQCVFHCNNVGRGTGITERTGKKILMKELHVNGVVYNHTNADHTKIRIVVFYDKRPGTVFPVETEVFNTNDSFDFFKNDNRSRFIIIKDVNTTLFGPYSGIGGNDSIGKNINFKIKLNKITEFNEGTTGLVGDIETGALYVMAVADAPLIGSTEASMKIFTRMRFVDIMG